MRFIYLVFLGLLISCAHKPNIKELKKLQKASLIHKASYWKDFEKTPIEERIFPVDKIMLEYLNRANIIDGFEPAVKGVELSFIEKAYFKKVINTLPPNIKRFVANNLKGVFIVDDLGSSGLTDGISYDKDGSFMIYDRKVFQKKANDWCTWKEHSVFKEGAIELKCVIREEKENNEFSAFQFIFIHELGHVVNRGFREYLPFWEDKVPESLKTYPFATISWEIGNKKYVRKKYENEFKEIFFYRPEKGRQDNGNIQNIYNKLSKTRFPSLYSVINPFDDFAESFVIYYHTKILGKDYKIITNEGNREFIFRTCIQTNKCPNKIKLMKKLFESKL